MINNRQAGRRRGRGGGGNGQRPQGGGGRPDNGNRIDNRARGNAAQLLEKYRSLAADAQRQGDRVNTEYYLQFADHYFRVLSETRARQEEQGQQQRRPQPADPYRDAFGDFEDGSDYGDEGDVIRPGEQMLAAQQAPARSDQEQPRQEQPRDERDRGDQDRGDRERGDRDRNDRDRSDRDRSDRGERVRADQQRFRRRDAEEGARAPRSREEETVEAAEPVATVRQDDEPAAPRRRGRPPRRPEASPMTDDDRGVAEIDRLPPAIGTKPVVANDADAVPGEGEAPRPRRRRAPRSVDGLPGASAAE